MGRRVALAAGLLAMACGGCDEGRPSSGVGTERPDGDVPDPSAAVDARTVGFAVRGRWEDPLALRYRVERERCPAGVSVEAWTAAVDLAASRWNGTGLVRLAPADDGREADVTLGWRRGHHGACEPFGISTATAHSGPVEPGTFVHLDADRAWPPESLAQTVLHELGHVLGLGHSAAPGSLMQPQSADGADRITASEYAGLHSLYGGGSDRADDLAVVDADGARRATLRLVAPEEHSDFAVADVDGDGRAEVVVWRTDREGMGALMLYRFDDRCRLARTVGPQLGAVAPGGRYEVVAQNGRWLLLARFANGAVRVRAFDEYGMLRPTDEAAPPTAGASPTAGDLDGDGRAERVERPR